MDFATHIPFACLVPPAAAQRVSAEWWLWKCRGLVIMMMHSSMSCTVRWVRHNHNIVGRLVVLVVVLVAEEGSELKSKCIWILIVFVLLVAHVS